MNDHLNGGIVSLAFDDGWKCVYENALPLLDQRGISSTQYIITKYLDDPTDNYVGIDEVHDMARRGHEIGSHTVSHKHLPKETDETIQQEVALSLQTFQRLNLPVQTFAYPYGEYDERVVTAVKNAGYDAARSIKRGYNQRHTDRYLLEIQPVSLGTHLSKVKLWVSRARADNSWLIMTFHEINEGGRYLSVPPLMLEQILDHLVSERMRTVTIADGVGLIYGGQPAYDVAGEG